ncbi:Vegetative incompatibility protein HET-E-1 [Colletotrichum fructicola]|nr:Vegetative incompatibility protein HET-E-1 [Colletotrichum fructicola]
MWLLDTQTLKLQEIVDPSTVNYAILSHTWEHDEVSFQDISDLDSARKKAGFSKISKTCELARQRSIPYAWVDTCCIDKSSSAELSEAINSMFQWQEFRGILSRSPEEFVGGPKLHRNTNDEDVCDFSLANKGVRIDTTFRKGKNGIYVMNLGLSDSETGADVCISLVRTADGVHAVIHSTEHPIEKHAQAPKFETLGRRMVLGRLRDEIPSFKKDDSFGKPTVSTENRVNSMSENTRSHTNKVYFVDEESNDQLQDSEAKSARVTTFEISLETCSDFLFTEYYILVTGQVRIMDLATVLGTNQVRNLLALGVREWDPYLLDLHYHSDFSEESAFEASAVNSPSSPAAEGLSAECPLAPTET